MKKKNAKEWTSDKFPLKPKDINCDGCTTEGEVPSFCVICEVRTCGLEKGKRNSKLRVLCWLPLWKFGNALEYVASSQRSSRWNQKGTVITCPEPLINCITGTCFHIQQLLKNQIIVGYYWNRDTEHSMSCAPERQSTATLCSRYFHHLKEPFLSNVNWINSLLCTKKSFLRYNFHYLYIWPTMFHFQCSIKGTL